MLHANIKARVIADRIFSNSRNANFAYFCKKMRNINKIMFIPSKEHRLHGNASFELLTVKIGQTVWSVQVGKEVRNRCKK